MTAIIDTFPAYTIIEAPAGHTYDDRDVFAIGYKSMRGDTLYNFYRLGSVEYASKYRPDPAAAVERAKALGHEMYWANTEPTVLHDGPVTHMTFIGQQRGEIITFKGKRFRIEGHPGDRVNIRLIEIA